MQLPLRSISQATVRFSFMEDGVTQVCLPQCESGASLSLEPDARGFYDRRKLTKALTFVGADYQFLLARNQSADRCAPVGLLLETRPDPYGAFIHESQFTFRCTECDWNYDAGTATVTPETEDAYRLLLDNYETPYNILLTPNGPSGKRVEVRAQLATLAAGIDIEFHRIDQDEQGDYVGTDGWVVFYINNSDIYKGNPQGYQKSTDVVVFRYRQRNVPLVLVPNSNPPQYTTLNRSASGWQPLYPPNGLAPGATVIDYVKEPAIAGFKPFKLTGNGSTTPFLQTEGQGAGKGFYTFGSSTSRRGGLGPGPNGTTVNYRPTPAGYLGEFLSLDCGQVPADFGYIANEWIPVTGPDEYGANNAEACNGTGLNVREVIDETHSRVVYWRFGNFRFARCFPLINGLHCILSQTVAPYGGVAVIPPTPMQLGDFLTAPQNPATGDTGEANEVPRLLLSAGSDIKRFGASEPATRLLISLKQLLDDVCTLYNCGWFIDPVTGWLRVEHRVYTEAAHNAAAQIDLTAIEGAQLPRAFSYRTSLQPRFEQLVIANASTEDIPSSGNLVLANFYAESNIDYGLGACVVTKEGSNRATVSSVRLTGDVPAGVLNGESIPDSALFLLAPSIDLRLPDGNQRVSATRLQLRYWPWGRVAYGATLEGPGPLTLPNTATGTLPITGVPYTVYSVKPQQEQANQSVPYASLAGITGATSFVTRLASGGQFGKGEIDLLSGETKFTVWVQSPTYTNPGPKLHGRAFPDDFSQGLS